MQINPREKNALASFTHSDLFQSIFYSTLKGVNVFMLYLEIDFVKRTISFTTFSSLLDFDFIDEKLFCFYLYSYSTRYCSHRTWFCSYTQLAFVPSKFFPCWTFLCSFSTWYCTVPTRLAFVPSFFLTGLVFVPSRLDFIPILN